MQRSTQEKIDIYTTELKKQGVSPYTSVPLLHRLILKLGINITPPLSSTFFINFLLFALLFGPPWTLLMNFLYWQSDWILGLLFLAAIAGGLFGFIMAAFMGAKAKSLDVPNW
ncbi:DUF6404 family protein [uncultured Pseudoteredinibacter sp.]|uniref:DUF6404 family protein n=1 Tax=uncultured Pseudoteredinibacter sp. TaxID=1641701 RepID=UPI003419CF35